MKPVCVKCERFYRPKKNGFPFIEGMPKQGSPPAGLTAPDQWTRYKLWEGDLWECPDCGSQIVVGCGRTPIAEHYEMDFAEVVEALSASLLIKDC